MDSHVPPLSELARGLRKRTLVTVRLMARLGLDMARRNLGAAAIAEHVDEEDAVAAARDLLERLDGLKGLTMKLGQMVSYLDRSLPPKARRVLARLQASSRPMEFAPIAEVLRAELGDPDEVFTSFEREPFAAASLGQVHRAVLDGTPVAVKVQYPGLAEALRSDLRTINGLARVATMLSPVDGRALAEELSARVLGECDYLAEAAHQERFRELLAGHDGISIPAVHRSRTTRRVLTTELVARRRFEDFLAAPQAARDRAGAAIYGACFETIFRHGVYNADPHPGNYLFSDEGDVTLLDFGCVKVFTPAFVATWRRLAHATLDDDLAAFRAAWIEAGFVTRARGFDFAHQLAAMRVLYAPMLADAFTFTDEFIARVHDATVFRNRNKFRLKLPPDWLFVNRLQLGLFSVLAALGARARYGELFRQALGPR